MKRILVSYVLFLTLLLVSCQEQPFYFNRFQGTTALELEFLDLAPPDELYASPNGEEFEIWLRMKNTGAYDIEKGILTIGLPKEYLRIKKWEVEKVNVTVLGAAQERAAFRLPGKTVHQPFGWDGVVTVSATARLSDPQVETLTTELFVSACYAYQTEVSREVCIDTDIFERRVTEKVCQVSDISVGGTGSPLVVDYIEVQMLPNAQAFVRPQFVIHLSNAGTGRVINTEKVDKACSAGSISHKEFDTVTLEEVSFSEFSYSKGHIQCTPENIRLENGQAEVKCTLAPGLLPLSTPTYSTNLYLRFAFGYMESVAKEVQLIKLG